MRTKNLGGRAPSGNPRNPWPKSLLGFGTVLWCVIDIGDRRVRCFVRAVRLISLLSALLLRQGVQLRKDCALLAGLFGLVGFGVRLGEAKVHFRAARRDGVGGLQFINRQSLFSDLQITSAEKVMRSGAARS